MIWLWFRWLFSNSGVVHGSIGKTQARGQTLLIYAMAKHSLEMKSCRYCKVVYWSFTKSNRYCGRFACFRRLYEVTTKSK